MNRKILLYFRKNYSTHNALLLTTLDKSEGDVLELGSGIFSTPLLHWYCKNKGRRLITYEDDLGFFNFAKGYQSSFHSIRLVKDWNEVNVPNHAGLIFIDHNGKKNGSDLPGSQRGIDAIRLKDSADYIVIHDTEPKDEIFYSYDKAWENFRYRYDWKECRPWTSVVSNFKDVSKWDNSTKQ
ncbi:MAG: hypothetical protein NTX96_02255 [Candidatus Zambryskibacteria bacterium]|nr:hypothetical protein [Candidatus Zambryskibacteria bacterium]